MSGDRDGNGDNNGNENGEGEQGEESSGIKHIVIK